MNAEISDCGVIFWFRGNLIQQIDRVQPGTVAPMGFKMKNVKNANMYKRFFCVKGTVTCSAHSS